MTTVRSSRRRVLDALRVTAPPPPGLPPLRADTGAGDVDVFCAAVERAGAEVARLGGPEELASRLGDYPPWARARRVLSTLPGLPGAEVPSGPTEDAHGLADVDLAVVRAEFGVAESGALWVDEANVPHRALYFLAQHLVAVVSAEEIVADLHGAYARIGRASEGIVAQSWRGFIAGPSKTADIEQALVVGAHGPRSLLVCLV